MLTVRLFDLDQGREAVNASRKSADFVAKFNDFRLDHGFLLAGNAFLVNLPAAACGFLPAFFAVAVVVRFVMPEANAAGTDPIGNDAEFIVAIRDVRCREADRLQRNACGDGPSAEMIRVGEEHLACVSIPQANERVVGGRVAIVTVHICLGQTVQLLSCQEVIKGRGRSAVVRNR